MKDFIYKTIPLRRLGTKVDIADCTVFAASPAASYITGDTIVVDGGDWMTTPNNQQAMIDLMKSQLWLASW